MSPNTQEAVDQEQNPIIDGPFVKLETYERLKGGFIIKNIYRNIARIDTIVKQDKGGVYDYYNTVYRYKCKLYQQSKRKKYFIIKLEMLADNFKDFRQKVVEYLIQEGYRENEI